MESNPTSSTSVTPGEGYKILLKRLEGELAGMGTIDGVFVRDQVTYKKRPEKVDELCMDIRSVCLWDAQTFAANVKVTDD